MKPQELANTSLYVGDNYRGTDFSTTKDEFGYYVNITTHVIDFRLGPLGEEDLKQISLCCEQALRGKPGPKK